MNRRICLSLAVSLLLLGACAAAGASPSPTPSPLPPDALLLRVESTGGFMPADAHLTGMPSFSLYADGRVTSPGAQMAIYPGPALPAIQVSRVSAAGVAQILDAAGQVGLSGPDRQLDGDGLVADAPTTVITVISAEGRHVTRADALFETLEEKNAARRALRGFVEQLTNLRGWLGTEVAAQDEVYAWKSILLVVRVSDPATSPDPQLVNIQDWPLADPLATLGQPVDDTTRCAVLTGADADALRAPLTTANQLTHWRSGGKTFLVQPRPLLPDESGCPQPRDQ